MKLDDSTPKSVSELASELNVSEDEIEYQVKYLKQYGFAKRTSEGICDTGKHDEFQRSMAFENGQLIARAINAATHEDCRCYDCNTINALLEDIAHY